jgi:hypothetical protein
MPTSPQRTAVRPATTRPARNADDIKPERGSPFDRSITGFRLRQGLSRSTYYRLQAAGRGPAETRISLRKVVISPSAEKAWELAMANPTGSEARLVAKMKQAASAQARKGAAAAKASAKHVSKRRLQAAE